MSPRRRVLVGVVTTATWVVASLIVAHAFGWPAVRRWWYAVGILSMIVGAIEIQRQTLRSRTQANGLVDGYAKLAGLTATVVTPLAPVGRVEVLGETWAARAPGGRQVERGVRLRVVGCHHNVLEVADHDSD